MAKKKNDTWAGFLLFLGTMFLTLCILWKNETRFDYYQAALSAQAISEISPEWTGKLISYTGEMDQNLQLKGRYFRSFQGYLSVRRVAEVYCWHRESRDSKVSWKREWMTYVGNNSRNQGLKKTLQSERFGFGTYQIDSLKIQPEKLEFTESEVPLDLTGLEMTEAATEKGLVRRKDCLYLPLNPKEASGTVLGDQRLVYRVRSIPSKATYFGKYDGKLGVPDTTHRRTGIISRLMGDTGILHHFSEGSRQEALEKIRKQLWWVRWLVRIGGTILLVFFLMGCLGCLFKFLVHIPVFGRIVEMGVLLGAIVIGVPLALATIITSYLVAHPVILFLLISVVVVMIWWIRSTGSAKQHLFEKEAEKRFGSTEGGLSLKEREFVELATVAGSDHVISDQEKTYLYKWGKKAGWNHKKCDQLMEVANEARDNGKSGEFTQHATDEHLKNVVLLALADGNLTSFENKTIWRIAKSVGYDNKTIRAIIQKVRDEVDLVAV